MPLEENIRMVRERIARAAREAGRDPGEITLEAATKVQTSDTIRAAIAAGITVCGENRVQELTAHLDDCAYDGAQIHFIGHLQTNKVRFVAGRVDLIESVDSLRLLEAVDRQAARLGSGPGHPAGGQHCPEASKGGCLPEDLLELARRAGALAHVRVRGGHVHPPPQRPVPVETGDILPGPGSFLLT